MAEDWHKLISQLQYDIQLEEDVWVPMRDGVRLCVDIYRPRAKGEFPALTSFSWYGKESQKLPTSPVYGIDPSRGDGGHECGEQGYYVPKGYVQVIPDVRGIGKSEGELAHHDWAKDGADLISWNTQQPWCNGNVGMVGMSSFALSQYFIAAEQPPGLKAIFPFEGMTDRYRHSISVCQHL